MSANPILVTPATATSYSNITDSFILQSPVMTWTNIPGDLTDTSLPIFTITASNFPKTMALSVIGDFQLYDGTYYAGFGIDGPCSLCIPSDDNVFATQLIDNYSGYNFATNNPSGDAAIYIESESLVTTNPASVQYVLHIFVGGFSTCSVTGRFTISSSNYNGLDSITFP